MRLQQSNWIEHFSADLESRRAANDFKREEVVRSDAGPPGNEHNLFPVRPGSHVLNRLSEKRPKKLMKGVDRQADSATLMESGSNTDQTIAKG